MKSHRLCAALVIMLCLIINTACNNSRRPKNSSANTPSPTKSSTGDTGISATPASDKSGFYTADLTQTNMDGSGFIVIGPSNEVYYLTKASTGFNEKFLGSVATTRFTFKDQDYSGNFISGGKIQGTKISCGDARMNAELQLFCDINDELIQLRPLLAKANLGVTIACMTSDPSAPNPHGFSKTQKELIHAFIGQPDTLITLIKKYNTKNVQVNNFSGSTLTTHENALQIPANLTATADALIADIRAEKETVLKN